MKITITFTHLYFAIFLALAGYSAITVHGIDQGLADSLPAIGDDSYNTSIMVSNIWQVLAEREYINPSCR